MSTKVVEYSDGDTLLEGYLAMPEKGTDDSPLVMVFHAFAGRDTIACSKADAFAKLGYIGFAVDIYGKGVLGQSREENSALMMPFIEDRQMLRKRIYAGWAQAKTYSNVIGAAGYCFGGLCALDLARSGADVKGVVSLHGNLKPPNIPNSSIQSKVLILHGHDDPHVPQEDIQNICTKMTEAHVDWQFHSYSHTVHAFTNPEANDPDFGTVYSKTADERSWQSMKNFFNEVLRR